MNYYNEYDKKAAAWLRELIKAGLIPAGDVDERSIVDVQPKDLDGYTQCHFFAGIGGWSLALQLADWPSDRPVWTGSCPCQPFSSAGKGKGTDDERHLWPEFARLIRECKPATVFGEQVASKAGREWFDGVSTDLEDMGYAAAAADLCAAGVGAPHVRQRLWWVADANLPHWLRHSGLAVESKEQPLHGDIDSGVEYAHGQRRQGAYDNRQPSARLHGVHTQPVDGVGHAYSGRVEQGDAAQSSGVNHQASPWAVSEAISCGDGKTRRIAPGITPLAHGVSGRVAQLRGLGNAIVPQVASEFIQSYLECM